MRLGWSHGDQEVFTREEMIRDFDIRDVNKAAAAFNPGKLLWLNQQHMMRMSPAEIAPYFKDQLKRIGIEAPEGALVEGVIAAQRERAKTLKEMAANSRYFFMESVERDAKAFEKHLGPEQRPTLAAVREKLAALPEWVPQAIHAAIADLATERGVGLGKLAQPLRVALTGSTVSPPIDQTVALIGRKRALERIDAALRPNS